MLENRPSSERVLTEALLEGYQGVEMDAAYRASLLAATRSAVISRRTETRSRLLTLAAAVAALPASVAVSVALYLALQTTIYDFPRAWMNQYQAGQAREMAQLAESFGPESGLPQLLSNAPAPRVRKGNR
jgi:hypothetical protein